MSEILKRVCTSFILALILFILFIYLPNWVLSLFLIFILCLILFLEWPQFVIINSLSGFIFTLFYPVLPFVLMIFMQQTNLKLLNLFIFMMAFSFDAGSFVFGKLFGIHKLSSKISPSKTWQGFVGGCLTVFIISQIFFFKLSLKTFPIILLICCAALLGDLFESYLKRRVGLKDSGTLLPGHGGLLDRFDSVLFVAVVVFFLRNYILKFIFN